MERNDKPGKASGHVQKVLLPVHKASPEEFPSHLGKGVRHPVQRGDHENGKCPGLRTFALLANSCKSRKGCWFHVLLKWFPGDHRGKQRSLNDPQFARDECNFMPRTEN